MRTEVSRDLITAAPFDAAAVHAYLHAHATPGRDLVEAGILGASTHAIDVAGGLALARVAWNELREVGDTVHVPVTLSLPDSSEKTEAETVSVLRRMFDLDADPAHIADVLASDPLLAPLIAARPGLRLPGSRNPAESALGTVLGQQVSLAAARTLQGRLAAAFQNTGPGSGDAPEGWCAALDIAAIADTEVETLRSMLGLTNARAQTLQTLAAALHAGLDLSADADHATARAQLLELRGIGPWSVEIIALRVLGDRDAYPAGDLILRRALDVRTDREAVKLAETWRPLRGYATQHLWAGFLATQAEKNRAGLTGSKRRERTMRVDSSDRGSRAPYPSPSVQKR